MRVSSFRRGINHITLVSKQATMDRKRVRRGESFGRMGVDRTISNSLKSPSRQKQRQVFVHFTEDTPTVHLCSNFEEDMTPAEIEGRKRELWYTVRRLTGRCFVSCLEGLLSGYLLILTSFPCVCFLTLNSETTLKDFSKSASPPFGS